MIKVRISKGLLYVYSLNLDNSNFRLLQPLDMTRLYKVEMVLSQGCNNLEFEFELCV